MEILMTTAQISIRIPFFWVNPTSANHIDTIHCTSTLNVTMYTDPRWSIPSYTSTLQDHRDLNSRLVTKPNYIRSHLYSFKALIVVEMSPTNGTSSAKACKYIYGVCGILDYMTRMLTDLLKQISRGGVKYICDTDEETVWKHIVFRGYSVWILRMDSIRNNTMEFINKMTLKINYNRERQYSVNKTSSLKIIFLTVHNEGVQGCRRFVSLTLKRNTKQKLKRNLREWKSKEIRQFGDSAIPRMI